MKFGVQSRVCSATRNEGCVILQSCFALVIVLDLFAVASPAQNSATAAIHGKEIYLYGTGFNGVPIEALEGEGNVKVPAAVLRCANCHGPDGQGKPEGGLYPSNIRWSELSKPYAITTRSGRERPPYSESLVIRAITMGIDSGGNRLNPAMPKYRLTRDQADDLVAYLLLDEPFASLDTPFRLHLRRELLRILRRLDLSVVLVTHDPQEAYELVEEVIVIAAGRVLQQGRREEVFGFPSSALVAKLLGFRNTFRGQVVSSTPEANIIEYQNFSLSAPAGPLVPGEAVDFFVNPQALTLFRSSYSESLPTGTVLRGVIDAIWPRPSGNRLAVIVGNGTNPDYWEVEEVPHNGCSPERWSERDPVRLFLPQTSIHVMCQEAKAVSASHARSGA